MVSMSGGVDSSVTALLLKQQGYSIEGLFMQNWERWPGESYNCSVSEDLIDTKAVCLKLGIKLHTVNFAKEYWDHVFQHFLDEYKAGRTPNPDITCNREIKFKFFLEHALELGASYMATGHYARVKPISSANKPTIQLLKGVDSDKDQSYFLYSLDQKQLQHALFPLGNLTKNKVRKIALQHGLRNHNKKGSKGICFIGPQKFRQFLKNYLPACPGEIQTLARETIGEHQGLMFYTIGQRQGLGIGGQKQARDEPWYVIEKDLANNVLIVGQGTNHPQLFKKQTIIDHCHWINQPPTMNDNPSLKAKIRYRQIDQSCQIKPQGKHQFIVSFFEPQRAISKGQSIVFYDGDVCLGGGVVVE